MKHFDKLILASNPSTWEVQLPAVANPLDPDQVGAFLAGSVQRCRLLRGATSYTFGALFLRKDRRRAAQ